MSDSTSNGSGAHSGGPPGPMGDKVARELFELVAELGENRRQQVSTETRILGLARVLMRGIPFGPEQADDVADVITSQGDLEHARGSKLYAHAARIRGAGKG